MVFNFYFITSPLDRQTKKKKKKNQWKSNVFGKTSSSITDGKGIRCSTCHLLSKKLIYFEKENLLVESLPISKIEKTRLIGNEALIE